MLLMQMNDFRLKRVVACMKAEERTGFKQEEIHIHLKIIMGRSI